MVLVGRDASWRSDKGGNMAAPLLAEVLGGTGLLGFIAAVAFATILAVVAGLTLSGAAALSHDLWASIVSSRAARRSASSSASRAIATVVLGIVAIVLGIAFKGQNVAFMVGLAFAVAASGNFPALVLAMFWRRATTAGMVASILVGTLSALVLVYLSPTIQIELLHHDSAWFPLKNPALVSMPLSFGVGVLVSLLRRDVSALEGFDRCRRRTILGAESDDVAR